MAESTTDQPMPEGEVLLISAVLEPATQFDPKQMQLRFEAGGPFEEPGNEYMEMVNEIARACSDVAGRMLGKDVMPALLNEVGMTPGAQITLFSISFQATGETGAACTFSAETAINPAFMTANDRLVQRTADDCKEASLPIFTRRYPDCGGA
ncbi:MAG: hypothetical protein ABFC89_02095 [Methanospirillum sp.]